MSELMKNFVLHKIAEDTYLDVDINGVPARIKRLSEREDSCSQCITEYVWYEDLTCADRKLKRAYLGEIVLSKKDFQELSQWYLRDKNGAK